MSEIIVSSVSELEAEVLALCENGQSGHVIRVEQGEEVNYISVSDGKIMSCATNPWIGIEVLPKSSPIFTQCRWW